MSPWDPRRSWPGSEASEEEKLEWYRRATRQSVLVDLGLLIGLALMVAVVLAIVVSLAT